MSDDLVKRLDSLHKQATVERSHFYVGSCAKDAADRIEELEGKLVWAMEYVADYSSDPHLVEWSNVNLAELKGQDDE